MRDPLQLAAAAISTSVVGLVAGCGGGGGGDSTPTAVSGTTGVQSATLRDVAAMVQFLRASVALSIAGGTVTGISGSGSSPCPLGGTQDRRGDGAVLTSCVTLQAPALTFDKPISNQDVYAIRGSTLGLATAITTNSGRITGTTSAMSEQVSGMLQDGDMTLGGARYTFRTARVTGNTIPEAGGNGYQGTLGGSFDYAGASYVVTSLAPIQWTSADGIRSGKLNLAITAPGGSSIYEVTFSPGLIQLSGQASTPSSTVVWGSAEFAAALTAATQP